jgi:hypothetical protein
MNLVTYCKMFTDIRQISLIIDMYIHRMLLSVFSVSSMQQYLLVYMY